MKTIMKALTLFFLMGALAGGVWLTRNKQDTRRGAAVADTSASVLPSKTVVNIGGTVKVHVFLNTGKETDLLSGAEFKVAYGSGLKYTANEILVTGYSIVNSVIDDGAGTLTFNVVAMGTEKGGAIDLLTISFDSKAVAIGDITVKEAKLMINGQSTTWDVATYVKGEYGIVVAEDAPTTVLTPTGTLITCSIRSGSPVVGCPDGYYCKCNCCPSSGMVGCAQYDTCEKNIPTAIPTVVPTVKPTISTLLPCDWCGSSCVRKAEDMVCATVLPPENSTCSEINGQCVVGTSIGPGTSEILLGFKMAFAGVTTTADCAKNWPVEVVVRQSDGTNIFSGRATLVVDGTANNLRAYKGEVLLKLPLNLLPQRDGLALFIKGPRHIQTKYGKDGQNDFYNKSGGEISVDARTNNKPVFDFTKYPMLAGDVTSENGGQDGMVNGLDFAYVKSEVIKRSEGDNILADLNGNCKLESQDLSLLMQSLRNKAEQLY